MLSPLVASPPPLTPDATTAKPWTRWWWPGSAVDEVNLTRQLEAFAAAGLGGVEITPIFGVRGAEDRVVPYLSPRWMDLLAHVGREARRLGLGVDMATGTGWPFGGPWVEPADGAHKLVLTEGQLAGIPTRMQVKRAAPGAEGLVIDPYSPDALRRYLRPFDAAFAAWPRELVRGQFHDSFEYYEAGWTPALFDVFAQRHGYDLRDHAAALLGGTDTDAATLARLKGDYRAVLAELHLHYLQTWRDWSHAQGWIVRNQSHGAPANLLDLYGAVDVPETETFGSTPFPIPGLRTAWSSTRDIPESLVIRLAASAAHVMGRPLVSSETCTWLREHWQEALAFTKPEIDRLFTDGINHIFYHGAVYSPADAAWPGWLFYASTQFNPANPWWIDFAALNAYVTRVQAVLQAGRPDREVLVYWPFHDVIDDPAGLMRHHGVHDVGWLVDSPYGRLSRALLAAGHAADGISDAQLADTTVRDGTLHTPGGAPYRALLVPATRRLPVETLARLLELARGGATVIFEAAPEDVPGLGRLEARRETLRALLADLPASGALLAPDPLAALTAHGLTPEPIAATGLRHIRRATTDGHAYFIANLTAEPFEGWVGLARAATSAILVDPLNGRRGAAALQAGAAGKARVYLQVAPGQSRLLLTSPQPTIEPTWPYTVAAGDPVPLDGEWTIDFIAGGPALPAPLHTRDLRCWTELGDETVQPFAGTARYRLEFDAPAAGAADTWLLDLGDVRNSARVSLNGDFLATAWSLPFRVPLGDRLRPGRNVLEIEVTNLAANRIRDLDRRGVDWKIMHEINFVDIDYRPFDASAWPTTPSGLLGPVRLVPQQIPRP
jgi:hypothetical protein